MRLGLSVSHNTSYHYSDFIHTFIFIRLTCNRITTFSPATPYKPVNVTTEFYGDVTKLSWTPDAFGVLVQEFELWYRLLGSNDYHWKYITFRQFGNETANITGLFGRKDYLFRIRGQNNQGLGPFSDACILFKNGTGINAVKDPVIGRIVAVEFLTFWCWLGDN